MRNQGFCVVSCLKKLGTLVSTDVSLFLLILKESTILTSSIPFHSRQLFTVKRRCGRELFLPFKDKGLIEEEEEEKKKRKMQMKTEWM